MSGTTAVAAPRAARVGSRHGALTSTSGRGLGLVAAAGVLLLLVLASLVVGAKPIAVPDVLDAFTRFDPTVEDHLLVRRLRVPRTLAALLVGAALGLAGALMQGLTRNPLADPGILGVSAGAALAVVVGIFVLGVTSLTGYVWFAFAGAAVTSVVVYLLGALVRDGLTPVKLALAGAAVTAFLASLTTTILLVDVATLDQYRFWAVGSVAGRDMTVVTQVAPFVGVGVLMALLAGRSLNALALGDDVARALGARVGASRVFSAVAVVLLVGGATAAAGPIGFVGLTVPHVARAITGPDYRWVLAYSALLAPVFIALVRRRTLAQV